MLYFWLFLIGLYAVVSFKVEQWQTLSRLGFSIETPALYIRNPKIYHYFCYALFLIVFFLPILLNNLPIWGLGIVIIVAFMISGKSRVVALKKYRNILQEMLQENDSDEQFNIEIKKKLQMTDIEIWNALKENERAFAK